MPGPTVAEKLKVVLLYEPRFVKKAMVTYGCLARELAADFETDLRVWRLEIAIAEGFADRVARDLEAADVILIAVRGDQPCPAAFQRWTSKSGAPRGAIIALTEVADGAAPSVGTWSSVLRVAATQIHPEIYVWDPLPADDSMPIVVEDSAMTPIASLDTKEQQFFDHCDPEKEKWLSTAGRPTWGFNRSLDDFS